MDKTAFPIDGAMRERYQARSTRFQYSENMPHDR
jgi:hypothetical protein